MAAKTATTTSFDLLGKRWSALIVQELMSGPLRFRQLLNHLSRINDKVLSQRLKELEGAKILNREVFAEVPIRVEYSLTDKGSGLVSVIKEMEHWDTMWSDANGHGTGKSGHTAKVAEREAVGAAAGGRDPATSLASVAAATPGTDKGRRGLLRRLGL